MRAYWLGVGMLLVVAGRVAAGAGAREAPVYAWLVRQQAASGLLANQEGDTLSGIYADALAAMAYVHEGDVTRAERVLDVFARAFPAAFAGEPGGFHQMWDPGTGQALTNTDRWIGDHAWLLMALNYHAKVAGDGRYAGMRAGLARWLEGQQDADGGMWSGYNAKGRMAAKSTEANLDIYAALGRGAVRDGIRRWLVEWAWVEAEGRFRMGSTVDESALDGTSWGIAALGREYGRALETAEAQFGRRDTMVANGRTLDGFSDFIGRPRIWLEGTGQMAVAYALCGRAEEARRVRENLEAAMVVSERWPETCGLPCVTSHPDWVGADSKIFVPSQVWFLFASWGFNPFEEGRGVREEM